MAAAAEPMELELEAAAILCDLKRILRARDRRRRRRMRQQQQQRGEAAPEIPSWGRRRLRSVLLEDPDSKPAAAAAERDGAASPDTPLAFFPDSSVAEEDDNAARKAREQEEWVLQQRGVVAALSQENADLLKQIEEYRARLMRSRSSNESLKQLHKVRQQEEQARMMRVLLLRQGMNNPRPVAALGLVDLNEPAGNEAEETAAAAASKAMAMARAAAAQERYWQVQQVQKAAVTAEARRRRLEILRAKVASPLVSCRTRRVVG